MTKLIAGLLLAAAVGFTAVPAGAAMMDGHKAMAMHMMKHKHHRHHHHHRKHHKMMHDMMHKM
jgi:hypothetical protein